MKKKLGLIFLCGIVLLSVCGCSNTKTKNIKCDELKNIKYGLPFGFITTFGFITKNGDVYVLDTEQLYSNDANCKKVNENELKIVKIIENTLYGSDGNIYRLSNYGLSLQYGNFIDMNLDEIVNDDAIIYYKDGRALKQDGKLYKYEKTWKIDTEFDFNNEKIIEYSFGEGGYIKTDKAFYIWRKTNKEQCEKYADIRCEYSYLKDEYLTELYDEIAIYRGTEDEERYTYITKDGKYVNFHY